MSESLEMFTFPRFRDEHLKPLGRAIVASSSSDMRNKNTVSEDKIESPPMLWWQFVQAVATAAKLNSLLNLLIALTKLRVVPEGD